MSIRSTGTARPRHLIEVVKEDGYNSSFSSRNSCNFLSRDLSASSFNSDYDSAIKTTILDTGLTLDELAKEVTSNPYLWDMFRKDLHDRLIVTDVGVYEILNKFVMENIDEIMMGVNKRKGEEMEERRKNGTWNRFKRASVDMITSFRSVKPEKDSPSPSNTKQRTARRSTMLGAGKYAGGRRQSKGDIRRSTMNMIGNYSPQGQPAIEKHSSLRLEKVFGRQERNKINMLEEEITEEERRRMHEEMKNPSPQVSQNSLYYISGDDSDKDCSLLERISQTSFGKLTSKISAMLAEEELHPEEVQSARKLTSAPETVECKHLPNETLPTTSTQCTPPSSDSPTKPLSMQERRQQVFADAHKKNTKKWRKVPSMQALKKKMTTKGAKLKSDRRFSLRRSSRCSESSSSVSSSAASVLKPSRRHSFTFCQGSASITTAA